VIHLTVDREALATLIRHELAKDSAGFGSCDLGATIADQIVLSFEPPTEWVCDHGCKGITAEFVAAIHEETWRTHKVARPASTTGSEQP